MNPGKIGIMGAMEEEISSLIDLLTDIQIDQIGGRTYYSGKLNSYEKALAEKTRLEKKYPDSFIVAFENEKLIPVKKAREKM